MKKKPKPTKEDKKWQKYLDDHKHLVGLAHYEVLYCIEPAVADGFAEVEADIRTKVLKVRPTEKFFKQTEKFKEETMMHELVHGRILIYQNWMEEVTEDLEEDLANDLTKGILENVN